MWQAPSLIEEISSPENLFRAWRKVRQHKGIAGIDGVSIEDFEKDLEIHITQLSQSLKEGNYTPFPVEPAEIPKEDGTLRKIAILAVRDRLVQRAVLNVVDPICDRKFLDCSFAYRMNRSVEMAAMRVDALIRQGFCFGADMDITDFFGSLRHDILLSQVKEFIPDEAVVHLISRWLAMGILDEGNGEVEGQRLKSELKAEEDLLPQGKEKERSLLVPGEYSSSPLTLLDHPVVRDALHLLRSALPYLAPYLLKLRPHLTWRKISTAALMLGGGFGAYQGIRRIPVLKKKFERKNKKGAFLIEAGDQEECGRGTVQGSPISPLLANIYLHPFDAKVVKKAPGELIRYGDDFLILCKSEQKARKAYQIAEEVLKMLGLQIHPAKSKISSAGLGFEFLGYHFTQSGFEKG